MGDERVSCGLSLVRDKETYMLVNVERRVCRSEHLGSAAMRVSFLSASSLMPNSLVDVVYTDSLQDLCLHNVSDARLGHDLLMMMKSQRPLSSETATTKESSRESRRPP
jgi:hypothetical protein